MAAMFYYLHRKNKVKYQIFLCEMSDIDLSSEDSRLFVHYHKQTNKISFTYCVPMILTLDQYKQIRTSSFSTWYFQAKHYHSWTLSIHSTRLVNPNVFMTAVLISSKPNVLYLTNTYWPILIALFRNYNVVASIR